MTDICVDNNDQKNTHPAGSIISSWAWIMDYVHVNGLSTRIGLPKDRFIEFIVKETDDYALDFIQKEASRLIKKYSSFISELKVMARQAYAMQVGRSGT